jgi:hypothetical protein
MGLKEEGGAMGQDSDKKVAKAEPKPGEGVRSLDTWKRLAQARAAQQAEGGDPATYFQRFGIEDLAPNVDSSTMQMLDGRLGVVDPLSEMKVDARRGAVAVVVAPVAAVAVNVVGGVSWGVAAQVGVNVNAVKNWNETCGCGKPY